MNSCAYCGERAVCLDHVIPRAFLSPAKRTGKEPGFRVPSCKQCNSILGDRIFKNLVERKAFIHDRLEVKLEKWAYCEEWTEKEMKKLGPGLRSKIDVAMARRRIALDRISYSSTPPDLRWLEMEERWRSKMELKIV